VHADSRKKKSRPRWVGSKFRWHRSEKSGFILGAGGDQFAGRRGARRIEEEFLFALHFVDSYRDRVFALEGALEQFFGKRVFQQVFDCPPERSGTELGTVAFVDQQVLGLVRERLITLASSMSMMFLMSPLWRLRKTMMSSTRLRNSGRNVPSITCFKVSFIFS
jgi:hypothetical protein